MTTNVIIDKEAGSSKTESNTLYIGNLSSEVEEKDVIELFKSDGGVVEVRLAMTDDVFAGYGEVEFATPEAAQQALKHDGETLVNKPVCLFLAKEICAFHPGNERYYQGKTVFVRGFGADDKFENVRHSLMEHFSSCGMFGQMIILRIYATGGKRKGDAFIYYGGKIAFDAALKLNGTVVGGCKITVEEAKPRADAEKEVESYDDSDSSSYEEERESKSEEEERKTQPQPASSKALFIGNLHPQTGEMDIITFFKAAGHVAVKVYLMKKDDQFQGYGFVEFGDPLEAQQACKLDQKELHDRPVMLHLLEDMDTYPPCSVENVQTGGETTQGKSVFVKGFGMAGHIVHVANDIRRCFGSCGDILRIRFPEPSSSMGLQKAEAIIDFDKSHSVTKALALDGSDVGGCKITVEAYGQRS